MQRVQSAVGGEPAADVIVDVARRHFPGVQAADHDALVCAGEAGSLPSQGHANKLVTRPSVSTIFVAEGRSDTGRMTCVGAAES